MNTVKKAKTLLSKTVALIMCIAMLASLVCVLPFGASAAPEANQAVMDAKQGVVMIQVWFIDPEAGYTRGLHSGSGFLINKNTIVTNDHVATGFTDAEYLSWTHQINELFGLQRTVEEVKNLLQIRVIIYRDVYVRAHVHKASSEMDFAILTLEEDIMNRKVLPLRSSSTLKQTEAVYSLGFPGDLDALNANENYDADDVAVTSGNVNKVAKMTFMNAGGRVFDDVEFIEHSANISGGNSGGPLVDANGAVVGVNSQGGQIDSTQRNLAVSIDQVIAMLDALGIPYTPAGSTPDPIPTEPQPTEQEEQPTRPVIQEPDNNKVETEEKEGFFDNSTNVILVAVAAVVLVLVIVIVSVVSKGKKSAASAPVHTHATAPVHTPAPAPAPVAPPAYTPPAPVAQPVQRPMTAPVQEAGETTVLNQGAGETTVLSKKVSGGKLVRKSSGEVVEINSESFVIGRERKNVNYCIANNTSISRTHAKILVKNGAVYIVDMGTANGTYVNGVKAEPRHEIELKNGDKITLADEELEYQI